MGVTFQRTMFRLIIVCAQCLKRKLEIFGRKFKIDFAPLSLRQQIVKKHGAREKFDRHLVANIYRINSSSWFRNLYTMGMAYTYTSFCLHVIR